MGCFFAGCFTPAEIKSRYRELAKKHHPDRPNGDTETFKRIASEYEAVKSGQPVPRQQTVWGKTKRRNRINKLHRIQQDKQLKKAWVYYAYQTTLLENGQQLTRTDLEYIAEKLGYSPIWAKIKCEENNIV